MEFVRSVGSMANGSLQQCIMAVSKILATFAGLVQLEAYPGAVDSLLWPRTHAAPLTNCACSCARGDVEHLCKARMGPARPHALLLLRADLVHVAMSSYSIPLPVSLPHPSFCLSLSLALSLAVSLNLCAKTICSAQAQTIPN